MANTTNLVMPLMSAAQSQKHLTHNDAIVKLDVLVQLAVISTSLTAPPGSPADGDRYIVGSAPTGAWTGKDLNVAYYSNGVWQFAVPRPGWQAYDIANNDLLVWNGTAWIDLAVAGGYASTTSATTFTDNLLTLQDNADNTKKAQFELSGITTATTRVYTLPNVAGALASLGNLAQTFTGAMTFSGTFVVSAATSSLGTSTAASTINVGTGATLASTAKTVNIGTGGVSTSTTTVNIGSTTAGALGTLNINSPTVTFGTTNTQINLAGSTILAGSATDARLLYLGLGGATADATNRLSLNTPAVLFNNAGAGINATVNKAAAGNDASFTFQTAFSTRALFGLLADDHFTIKVSPNGSSFFTGVNIRNADGHVGLAGATADANNGLIVNGNILFNTDNAASQMTAVNKQAAANDAGFTFQTNFSTRAIFGTLASDNFTLKVSPNGSSFTDAIVVDATTGRVSMPVGPGRLRSVQKFTAGGTWTRPSGVRAIVVEVVGGGGGGGGVTSVASSAGCGGGGGAGAYVRQYIDVTALASAAVLVGAAGTAGANTGGTGGTGGTSSFNGAVAQATGGLGGVGQVGAATPAIVLGGNGGTASPTTVNVWGHGAVGQMGNRVSGTVGASGGGAAGPFGGGGLGRNTAGAGDTAAAPGAGGGGALSLNGSAAAAGGAGAPGLVVVYEYE
ncbi:hypothetical protein RCRUDOLPH_29 [Rhodobacter phage RcRudolph]|nr:hypothetical protein RCRUDOLPH_29 [Rhodobacter phage RcRudolph]